VIDVPGIFKRTTPGVTTKSDMEMVERMVYGYMRNPRSVMLTVVPANVDIATQEILEKTTQAHLVQEAFDYAFETSLRKPWLGLTYAIRLSSLPTNYIRFLWTRRMQRPSLGSRLASSQVIRRG
jgi:hypothetical protein